MKAVYFLLVCLLVPGVAQAVSISEVAWMGDAASANHEWIELYNPGAAVAVDGWVLSDGMNLNITLAGTLPEAGYAVLERTSEESASGSAFLVYVGALVNTGATLTLSTAAGEIQDQVSGGEDWQSIGGDNVTKETAQYSTSGWVTDTPTPGAVNGSGRAEVPATTSTESTSTTKSSPSTKSAITTPLQQEKTDLRLTIERQEVAYVGQPVRFLVEGSGLSPSEGRLLRYNWNFGDTHATSGSEVWHTYLHPGTYVVTVQARKGLDEQVVRSEVTVVPVALSVSFGEGVVHIHNNAPYDIDVSHYEVKASKTVEFPSRSIIKTGGTVTLGAAELGSWAAGVRVFDGDGVVVAKRTIGEEPATPQPAAPAPVGVVLETVVATPLQSAVLTEETVPTTTTLLFIPGEAREESVIDTESGRRASAVVLVVVLLILLGLYVRRHGSGLSER